ncbi:MAG: hypothetical protein ACOH1M_04035 [Rhodoglobus sp.]
MNNFLSPDQVVELIPGMTTAALAQLRFTAKGPRFYRPTPKRILYKREEVIQWIEDSARYGTALEAV